MNTVEQAGYKSYRQRGILQIIRGDTSIRTTLTVILAIVIVLNITLHLLLFRVNKRTEELRDKVIMMQEYQQFLQVQIDELQSTHKKLTDQVEQWLEGRQMILESTAYTANDPGMDGRGITYTGIKATEWRTAAVDPEVIPLGSVIYIPYFRDTPSRGWFRAEDVGGAIKGEKLDIYFTDRKTALKFGRRLLEVYVYELD